MNFKPTYFSRIGLALTTMFMLSSVLTSCDSTIYDGEGDCSVTYRMEFRYELNMKWADAFPHEVKSVHLYAFNPDGLLVWQGSESGDKLSEEDYAMTIDLPAGHYTMLAWCGLENDGKRPESFSVPQAEVGRTHLADLRCSLNREHDADGAFCRSKLYNLYHGMLDVELPDLVDGGEHTSTMYLTKDTNHVRIVLQHLSGEDVDEREFTYSIESENGLMDYDNQLLPDENITYHAYDITPGTAGLVIDDYPEVGTPDAKAPMPSRAVTQVKVAIADLSIPRLVDGHDVFLIIKDKNDGHTVANIPLADYALKLMSAYDEEMTPQEFLDRQDEYSLVFFLDESRTWIGSSIIINSWRVVLNDVKFE